MNTPVLFIWRESPIDVDVDMYSALIKMWDNKVFIYCASKMPEERVLAGVKTIESTIYITEKNTEEIKRNILINKEAIHIFPNIKGYTWETFGRFCVRNGIVNICTLGERANRQYNVFLEFASYLLNVFRKIKYGKFVKARIQMGKIGVKSSLKLGWKKEILYPFMYCPSIKNDTCIKKNNCLNKILYFGRFSKKYKGVDVLIKAIDSMEFPKQYTIDFVSGYGDFKDELIKWSKNKPFVNVLSSWKHDEIVEKMSEYDLIIIPSTHDGWNLNANYAVYSDVFMIITDAAGSDDLVVNNKNGFVVKNNNHIAIKNAIIKYLNENKSLSVEKTLINNILKENISSKVVASYLKSILEFTFCNNGTIDKPVCPWEVNL